jgi:Protein of unknown function (DUF3181)
MRFASQKRIRRRRPFTYSLKPMANQTETLERLAAELGEALYLDIAKWHLPLNTAKLHLPLAEQLYALMIENRLTEVDVTAVLQGFAVPVGGGRAQVPMLDLLPIACQRGLLDLLEAFAERL